jgi:uncharacterized protein
MATCPECDSDIDVDEYDVDKGDLISCPECGTNLEVVNVSPLEFEATPEDDDDDDLEDDDLEDEDDEDSDDETRTRTLTTTKRTGRNELVVELAEKEARLTAVLSSFDSLLVAYSGGVDSVPACAASHVLPGRVLCVTADSPSYPKRHREMAEDVARRFNLAHEFVMTAGSSAPSIAPIRPIAAITARPSCNEHLSKVASEGIGIIADGSNADDRGDYRPGRQAARDLGVRSPLDEADLTKDEIRELSRPWASPLGRARVGLPSSRIPYLRGDAGQAVDDRAGRRGPAPSRLPRMPRRHHDTIARLEIGRDEMPRALDPETNRAIVQELKAIGYQHVCLTCRATAPAA